jgi:hypothetical protein
MAVFRHPVGRSFPGFLRSRLGASVGQAADHGSDHTDAIGAEDGPPIAIDELDRVA